MSTLSYRQVGLVMKRGGEGATDRQIRDLQRALRRLGYLKAVPSPDETFFQTRLLASRELRLVHANKRFLRWRPRNRTSRLRPSRSSTCS